MRCTAAIGQAQVVSDIHGKERRPLLDWAITVPSPRRRLTYKQILVPVDGSQTALHALREAVVVTRAFGSSVFLVHVIDPYPFLGAGADFALGQADYLSAANANATRALAVASEIVGAAGLSCNATMVDGHAAEEGILDTARTCNADLIVMGSHGRRGIEKLLLGSVTQRVLQDARVPVLVVRGSEA